MLEQILAQHIFKDLANYGLSKLANGASLYLDMSRRGTDVADEAGKKDLQQRGLGVVVLDKTLISFGKGVAVGAVLYGVDYALGIESDALNSHHAFIYAVSLANWVSTSVNVARAFGRKKSSEEVNVEEQLNPEHLNRPLDLELLKGLDDYTNLSDEGRLVGAIRRFRDVAKRGEVTDGDVLKLYDAVSQNPVLRARYFGKDSSFNLAEQYLLAKDLIKAPSIPRAVQFLDGLDGKKDGNLKILDWAKKLAF